MSIMTDFLERCERYREATAVGDSKPVGRGTLSDLLFGKGDTLEGLHQGKVSVTVRVLERAIIRLADLERDLGVEPAPVRADAA